MPEPIYPAEFENLLRTALAVPDPDPAFMDSLRSQFVSAPNLTAKETKMKPSLLRFSPRLAWGLALLFLLALVVAAFSSPDVVNALRRLLGYIPGVGVVEQSNSLRVLAAPVTQSREGVTLTIEQAAATADKTSVVFHYIQDETFVERPATQGAVGGNPGLRLPDGSELKIVQGRRLEPDPQDPPGRSLRYRMEFGPLPRDVDHVLLVLPQLIPMQPGAGPENWEIPLDFRPSSGDELPVIEVVATPMPTAQPTAALPETPTERPQDVAFVLDKVVPSADGYIFMGYTQWNLREPDPLVNFYSASPDAIIMSDADGREIPFDYATPDWTDVPGREAWAFQVQGIDFHWPLTIETKALWGSISRAQEQGSPAVFAFDPGTDAQPGQEWSLDEEFRVGGYTTRVLSARMLAEPDESYHYEFTMDSPDGVASVSLIDLDHWDQFGGGMGGGGLPEPGPFTASLFYSGKAPAPGPIHLGVFDISLVFRGSWKVSWSPDGQ